MRCLRHSWPAPQPPPAGPAAQVGPRLGRHEEQGLPWDWHLPPVPGPAKLQSRHSSLVRPMSIKHDGRLAGSLSGGGELGGAAAEPALPP